MQVIDLSAEIVEPEEGLTAVRFDGDYKFADFLAQGGASSDGEVVGFLAENLLDGVSLDGIMGNIFGCSTLAAADSEGRVLFGRNIDWNHCDAMVVASYPKDGYASISTVNMDFITLSDNMICMHPWDLWCILPWLTAADAVWWWNMWIMK